ncbi:MAG: hypothetical protein HY927_11385 [Elusimicrobia bacterium]|nr:hypothetical protein [Elusimicrobiota bacterium]
MADAGRGAGAAPAATGAILLCAATRWEAGPLAGRLGLAVRKGRVVEGLESGRRVLLLRTGMGSASVSRSLATIEAAAEGLRPLRCVISTGLAGALTPELRTGDIVADLRGDALSLAGAAQACSDGLGLRLCLGKVAHAATVLATPEQKAALARAAEACAVDMESEPLRRWASEHGWPFLSLRVILDAADESLPPGTPDPEDVAALAGYALFHPHRIGALVRLGLRTRRCMGNLAVYLKEFIKDL